jgi:hypothetical protein
LIMFESGSYRLNQYEPGSRSDLEIRPDGNY